MHDPVSAVFRILSTPTTYPNYQLPSDVPHPPSTVQQVYNSRDRLHTQPPASSIITSPHPPQALAAYNCGHPSHLPKNTRSTGSRPPTHGGLLGGQHLDQHRFVLRHTLAGEITLH
ncbi:hypothetical protein PCANC_04816 [Puccinia coronata f. sp. avenae]|uniref:Uncharacterized protein n=1 Tax=Puccinia coronata f. sp. avenae TaxID=200324 RepID=A0A2N5W2N2_9BASI|nr:hypothetical protein PCANC_04816 [Puccinia coronata f. sp. avenae]